MTRRRCLECNQPLAPAAQGALCSACYFALICDPAANAPVPPAPVSFLKRC